MSSFLFSFFFFLSIFHVNMRFEEIGDPCMSCVFVVSCECFMSDNMTALNSNFMSEKSYLGPVWH